MRNGLAGSAGESFIKNGLTGSAAGSSNKNGFAILFLVLLTTGFNLFKDPVSLLSVF